MSEHDDRHDDQPAQRPRSLWGAPDPAPADGRDEQGERETPPGTRPDPRLRPPDPAGTQPKYVPEELLPGRRRRLRADHAASVVESDAIEDGAGGPPEAPGGDPRAGDGGEHSLLPERVGAAGAPERAAAHRAESPHAPRFQFALGALIAVGFAAVAAVVAIAVGINSTDTSGSQGPSWSAWRPVPDAGDGPTQIAEHVGREYRLPEGGQLVAVTGGPMEIAGLPLTVALREPVSQGGNIELIGGKGVLFRMCGLGPKCAIDKGKPSTQRHLLLRREALELSLYAFHYLDGIDHTVVFLPPRKGQEPTQALFFRKRDLEGALVRPLSATLVPRTPTVRSVTASPDASLVNTITTRTLFQFSFTQANQDARAFLVLEPLQGN